MSGNENEKTLLGNNKILEQSFIMSRIGKKPVPIEKGVEVNVAGRQVNVKGPLGQLSWGLADGVSVEIKDAQIHVGRNGDAPRLKALHGLTRMEMSNLMEGVTKGYERTLELTGVGYRAQMKGEKLVLSLGYSHEIEYEAPKTISIKCEKPTLVVLSGSDREKVGQTAAEIQSFRKKDPYKGKGVHPEGKEIHRKEGKKN